VGKRIAHKVQTATEAHKHTHPQANTNYPQWANFKRPPRNWGLFVNTIKCKPPITKHQQRNNPARLSIIHQVSQPQNISNETISMPPNCPLGFFQFSPIAN
jgi:hypothetical protein